MSALPKPSKEIPVIFEHSRTGAHMGKKHSAMAHDELRRFHKAAAVHGNSKIWMLSPFLMTQPQNDISSAQELFPQFARNPHWEARPWINFESECYDRILAFGPWEEFQAVLGQPKKKATGPHGIPPHLLSWLPLPLQYDIYEAMLQI